VALFERLVAADADNNSIKNTFQRFNPFCLPPFKSTADTDTPTAEEAMSNYKSKSFLYIDFIQIKLRNVYRHGKEFFDAITIDLSLFFFYFLVKGTRLTDYLRFSYTGRRR